VANILLNTKYVVLLYRQLGEVTDEKRIWLKFCIFHATFPAVHDTSSIGLFPLWVSYLQQNFSRRA
jgi:hypothetical protein